MTAGSLLAEEPSAADRIPRWRVISALGIVQIFSWGSSYYLLTALAVPIAADTGWPLPWITGGLTIGLVVAGLASPWVGRSIGLYGGRMILAGSCLILALGLAALSLAPSLPVFLLGWFIIGIGMGAGLYDASFATLGRIYGTSARRAISTLTLWGGFASTVCWPLTAAMASHFGWRVTCIAYAAIQLSICLPLILSSIPTAARPASATTKRRSSAPLAAGQRRALFLLIGVLVLGSLTMTMVSVHLLTLLQARGLSMAAAVGMATLIGPAQVAARLAEMATGGRHPALWTLLAAMTLIAIGLALLNVGPPVIGFAVLLYGAGNGIYSIARGAVPLALFGPEAYPALMGFIARPAFMASALAPSLGAVMLQWGGAELAGHILLGLALINVALIGALWRASARSRADASEIPA
ncbi:MFS transporter [Kaistia dalseonensis]|uniref:MFS family permease n=1 Tax=Kaistia dalseonensis TaxID=410840 RepID=A0ABU0HBK9_9HYPH|nr:MFS transporter [Kaistia dalseonensis]MCX5496278.1 MFS transporter [Kaistia dalseonensis]MDQ0438896.1 MFS family permease [Kaistia dalseonensis]